MRHDRYRQAVGDVKTLTYNDLQGSWPSPQFSSGGTVGRHPCATIRPKLVRVLIDYRPALRERTGVGEWVHSLACALAARRDEPPLELALFSSSWKDRPTSLPPIRTIDRRVPVRMLNYCWHRLSWPPVEWIVRERFDVVHSPHPLMMPSAHAARVVTIHDLDFLDHPEHAINEVRRDYPALIRRHVGTADHVVVPSEFTGKEVERRLGVPAERITVCTNGAPDWAPRRSWPESGDILFVGSLTPRKNIGGLLDAYRRLVDDHPDRPPPRMVLAGPATSQSADWLSTIDTAPWAGRVHWTGYLDKTALRRLYENAAVLVLPSWHEGFGLPVVEAMTVGVPVVASNRGALPEVVGDAGLTVDPSDPAQLAAAIKRMVTDVPFARACAERGFQQAARFSWRAAGDALVSAYRKTVTATAEKRSA